MRLVNTSTVAEAVRSDSVSMPQVARMKAQRPIDLGGELVRIDDPTGLDATNSCVPGVDPGSRCGEAALGEGPEEVQGRRRLVVRLHEPLRVRHAGRFEVGPWDR